MTRPLPAALSVATWPQPRPYVRRVRGGEWEAYIPPTRPEHFEYGDVQNGAVLGPWGESYWLTWAEACDFMRECGVELREAVGL